MSVNAGRCRAMSRRIGAGRVGRGAARPGRGALVAANAVGLFFGTTTGHTEEAADMIKAAWSGDITDPTDISEVDISSLPDYDALVVGVPTWHTGAEESRSGTAWDDVLDEIKGLDMGGKKVAIFGCGDSSGYGDYFCDAIEELHSTFKEANATLIGSWKVGRHQRPPPYRSLAHALARSLARSLTHSLTHSLEGGRQRREPHVRLRGLQVVHRRRVPRPAAGLRQRERAQRAARRGVGRADRGRDVRAGARVSERASER